MFTDPDPGETIIIGGQSLHFLPVPESPGIVYGEMGRKAKVYRLAGGGTYHALKVFKPAYRSPEVVKNTSIIARYHTLPGLAVAQRVALTPRQYPDLLQAHPDFAFAILMPWIQGRVWSSYIQTVQPLSAVESLRLARTLASALCTLEEQDIAHCDLSGANFIISEDLSHIELIDIEELYGIGLQTPNPLPAGTSGYCPDWVAARGLWEAAADRFAAGILFSEILGWQFEDVRQACQNAEMYFQEGEFGHDSERYRLLKSRLAQIHPDVPILLQGVWTARGTEDCPRIAQWKQVLDQVGAAPVTLNWGFEAVDLPTGVEIGGPAAAPRIQSVTVPATPTVGVAPVPMAHAPAPRVPTPAGPYTQNPIHVAPPTETVAAQSWPDRGGAGALRNSQLTRIFGVFVAVGVVMFFLILIFGDTIHQIAQDLNKQSGSILPDAISNAMMGLLVGAVHSWIFRYNITKSKIGLFILSSTIGGALGGGIAGALNFSGSLHGPYLTGITIGVLGGTLSSLGQNLFMTSKSMQEKWLLFNAVSWSLIWMFGTTISWTNRSALGLGGAAAIIIILSGAAVALFLRRYRDIEF